jgi:glycerol-3-phosphate dehydrogenase
MNLDQEWDIIVVGGGVTGAGIFRQAVHMGYKTLLLEQKDFAWGTSSRSSKLVHGGLRYLKEGRLKLVHDSVVERQRLLEEAPGLVEPLPFLVPDFKGKYPPPFLFRAGLLAYDLMAGKLQHDWLSFRDFCMAAPHIRRDGLTGGGRFVDAQVDDARLVLRVIFEGEKEGGTALNYTRAQLPRKAPDGWELTAVGQNGKADLKSKVIFSATGVWADRFVEKHPGQIRPLRGSHLVFPGWKLPLPCALSFNHPADGRPNFLIPWEGASFCGTTDLDHTEELDFEPAISSEEVEYMIDGLKYAVPDLDIEKSDIITTWAGVRPVISQGKNLAPSEETRDHALTDDDGLLTVTGGKLTTFRLMASEALEKAESYLPPPQGKSLFKFARVDGPRRLTGRYGEAAADILKFGPDLSSTVPGTHTQWFELPWAARAEKVHHLDDLLLRRTRLGMLLPEGGKRYLNRIRELCQAELGWDDSRWSEEEDRYLEIWEQGYGLRAVTK